MNLVKSLQLAMENIGKIASAVDTVTAAANAANGSVVPSLPATTTSTGNVTVTVPPALPANPDLLQKVETIGQEILPIASVIPGASSIVEILTIVVQLVNAVERMKNDVKTNNPQGWAEIESVFSSAVGAFESVPKK